MMASWKTKLGGALRVTGTTLMGTGVLGMYGAPDYHSGMLWYIALVGFILQAVGQGFDTLFSADSSDVKRIAELAVSDEAKRIVGE